MKRIIGIIWCLWLVARCYAVDYQQTSFRSTSIYSGEQRTAQPALYSGRPQTVGSISAISSSNFNALNSEGGAFYQPSVTSGPRKGRPGGSGSGGSGAIGELDFHSPVGHTPYILLAILATIYAFFAKNRKKNKKYLVVS